MSMGSFCSGSRVVDIIEVKRRLKSYDPRRTGTSHVGPDIGYGSWFPKGAGGLKPPAISQRPPATHSGGGGHMNIR
jgi:hypothetical protein